MIYRFSYNRYKMIKDLDVLINITLFDSIMIIKKGFTIYINIVKFIKISSTR